MDEAGDVRRRGLARLAERLRAQGLPEDACAATLCDRPTPMDSTPCPHRRVAGELLCLLHHAGTGARPLLPPLVDPDTGHIMEELVFFTERRVVVTGGPGLGSITSGRHPLRPRQCHAAVRVNVHGRMTQRCENRVYMGAPFCPAHALEHAHLLPDVQPLPGQPDALGVYVVDRQAGPQGHVMAAHAQPLSLVWQDDDLAERLSQAELTALYGPAPPPPWVYTMQGSTHVEALDTLHARALLSLANAGPAHGCNAACVQVQTPRGPAMAAQTCRAVINGESLLIRADERQGGAWRATLDPPLPASVARLGTLYDWAGADRPMPPRPAALCRRYVALPDLLRYYGQDLGVSATVLHCRHLDNCQPWLQQLVARRMCLHRELGATAWLAHQLGHAVTGELYFTLLRWFATTQQVCFPVVQPLAPHFASVAGTRGATGASVDVSLAAVALLLAYNMDHLVQQPDALLLHQLARQHGWPALRDRAVPTGLPAHARDGVAVPVEDFLVSAAVHLQHLSNALEAMLDDQVPWTAAMGPVANAMVAALSLEGVPPAQAPRTVAVAQLAPGQFTIARMPGFQACASCPGMLLNMPRLMLEILPSDVSERPPLSALVHCHTTLAQATQASAFAYPDGSVYTRAHRTALRAVMAHLSTALVAVLEDPAPKTAATVSTWLRDVNPDAPLTRERAGVDDTLCTLIELFNHT